MRTTDDKAMILNMTDIARYLLAAELPWPDSITRTAYNNLRLEWQSGILYWDTEICDMQAYGVMKVTGEDGEVHEWLKTTRVCGCLRG